MTQELSYWGMLSVLRNKTDLRFGSAIRIQRWFDAAGLDGDTSAKNHWLFQLYNGEVPGYVLTSDRSSDDRLSINNSHLYIEDASNYTHILVKNRGGKHSD